MVNSMDTRLSSIEQDLARHELIMEQLPSHITTEVAEMPEEQSTVTSAVICDGGCSVISEC